MLSGNPGIGPLQVVDTAKSRVTIGADAPFFQPAEHIDEKQAVAMDRFAMMAVVAAREAVRQAGITWSEEEKLRAAVVTGSCYGGKTSEDQGFQELYLQDRPRIHPFTIPRLMANAGTSWIAMEFGLCGPAFTVATACASANHAIGQAFQMVRSGMVDTAIAGGCEAPLTPGSLKAWEALRVTAPDTCRPFAKERKGMVLGEGAGMLVLEEWERAKARGATILGELCGFGMSADAHHLTQPLVRGALQAMRSALADAGIAPEQVDHVNAHGTGTPANDGVEAEALLALLGERGRRVPVSATKSMHGHALGAAGALEGIATVLALQHGVAPPTANCLPLDEACPLAVSPEPQPMPGARYAISNSFAFGGLNAVLVFARATD